MNNKNETMAVVAEGIMTEEQFARRKEYIVLMREFQNKAYDVAKAILRIREEKLYRPYRTLEEFCVAECGWTKQRFYQIKKFTEVREALPAESQKLLTKESQARELSKYPEDKRVEVLTEAKRNTLGAEKLTAKKIEIAAETVLNGLVDKTGEPIPEGDASYHYRRLPQGKEVLAKIKAAGEAVKALNPDDLMWIECGLDTVVKDLRAAWSRFKGGLPAYVCTSCGGMKPKGCKFCKGRGMVGTWGWKHCGDDEHAIERAVREARKKNGNAGS